MTYTSLIIFRVAAGRRAEFEQTFERTGMLTRPQSVDGFEGAVLHHGLDDPDTYIVIGSWRSADAYRQWQRRSIEETTGLDELLDTLVDLQPGQLFQTLNKRITDA